MLSGDQRTGSLFRFNRKKQRAALLLMLTLVLTLWKGIEGTHAYLLASANQTLNEFSYSKVTCSVNESFDGDRKKEVSLQNTGTIPAYLRCAVTVTWKDENNVILGKKPVEGQDYHVVWNLGTGWSRGSDGYYYWAEPVAPGGSTGILINQCLPVVTKTPEGYGLSVEIAADAVQAVPIRAVEGAWHVTVNGGTVSPP